MGKNAIRICSDPYRRHIDYYWYEENGTWSDLSEKDGASINTTRFISSQIPQIAYDVLQKIEEMKSPAGIKVIFEGTDDDYERLSFIREAYYADRGIELERGERTMRSAEEVMAQIEASFRKLEEYFKKYSDREMEEDLAKYRETVRPEIVLCVAGLYSSGKSAFINSLIGQEILPSASDPATAKIYEIWSSEECKIAFMFQNEKYEMRFDDKTWRANKASDSEIMKLIKNKMEEMNPKSTEQLMHWTLLALNDYAQIEGEERKKELLDCCNQLLVVKESEEDEKDEDERIEALLKEHSINELIKDGYLTKNKLGDSVEVSVDFRHSYLPLDMFKFVIYDTPGSNSAMFREHMDILQETLKQQTNGLPIFVATPDNMDGKENKKLLKKIDQMGTALDMSNMMVVVNKSDEKAKTDLLEKGEKKDKLAVTKWKVDRVYFVSSIMGLGGKKENTDKWIDKSYYEIFKKNIDDFSNPRCERYKRLFECNILPEDSKKRIEKRAKEIADKELLIWNSGIPCVEEEIGMFARKYALYNKCAQAIEYLEKAATKMEESVEKAKEKSEKLCLKIETKMDRQTKELIDELKKICDSKMKTFTSQFTDSIVNISVGKFLDGDRIKDRVQTAYDKSSGKNDFERLNFFSGMIERHLREDMKAYADEKSKEIEKYWKKCAEDLRRSLMRTVVGSSFLSDEQKALLKEVLLSVVMPPSTHKFFNIANTNAVRHKGKKFLWIDRTKIDKKKAEEKYKEILNSDISQSNMHVITGNKKTFDDWIKRILTILEAKLSDFNPNLRDLSGQLEEQQRKAETKRRHEDLIRNEINKINRLLEFEEVQG